MSSNFSASNRDCPVKLQNANEDNCDLMRKFLPTLHPYFNLSTLSNTYRRNRTIWTEPRTFSIKFKNVAGPSIWEKLMSEISISNWAWRKLYPIFKSRIYHCDMKLYPIFKSRIYYCDFLRSYTQFLRVESTIVTWSNTQILRVEPTIVSSSKAIPNS